MNEDTGDQELTDHDLDLIRMIAKDDPVIVENWAKSGGNVVNPFEKQSNSLLHVASYSAYNRVVETLLALGMDVDVCNESGKTPLMDAAQFGRLDTLKLLVNAGANVNRQDWRGRTALHWAATLGDRVEIVEYLCRVGADFHLKNSNDLTAKDYANQLNRELIQKFFELGSKPIK